VKIAIIGAGITGLVAGWRLAQKGVQVSLFEKEKAPGGLAHGFKEKAWNWYLDDFFHHLFISDISAQKLIRELGLSKQLFFDRPKTAIFKNGQISQFDSPLTLLKSPLLSWPQKIRAGLVTGYLKLTNRWQDLEKITATDWLAKFYGKKTFAILWEPLLTSKFGSQANQISMAWFWARIKKRSVQLGYLQGGFQVLADKLTEQIKKNKGQVIFNREIKNLKDLAGYDKIIITVPAEKFFKTGLPEMLGAINLILILKEKFLTDGTYWLSVNEKDFPFVAVVEQTNFVDRKNYGGNYVAYVGGYYPQDHRYFKMTKDQIFKEFLPYLKRINPNFNFASRITCYVSRNLFAQPVMPVNYSRLIAGHKTALPGVYLANMQQVYPWDRGLNYAIELGEKIVKIVVNDQ